MVGPNPGVSTAPSDAAPRAQAAAPRRRERDRRPAPDDNANAFRIDRLRASEWVVGIAAVALFVALLLPWYELRSYLRPTFFGLAGSSTTNGWSSFTVTNWLMLACVLLGVAAWWCQATRRAPALPIVLTVTLFSFGVVTSLLVLHAVVINRPGGQDLVTLRPGAIVGLISVIVLTVAAYSSLRVDGIRDVDGPETIETYRLRSGA